jgi:hypothetical protein
MKGLLLGLMAAVLATPTLGWGESEKPAFQLDTVVVTASGRGPFLLLNILVR